MFSFSLTGYIFIEFYSYIMFLIPFYFFKHIKHTYFIFFNNSTIFSFWVSVLQLFFLVIFAYDTLFQCVFCNMTLSSTSLAFIWGLVENILL